jgi:DtxR family Mn-dependent transcriptional regulator
VSGTQTSRAEEILEHVWTEREEGRDAAAGILAASASEHAPDARTADLQDLAAAGLVRLAADRVLLTPEGEARARDVVRRHRLTERLFRDLLDLGERTMEAQACEFEHILSREATDSVCTLLGHPPTCPHGKPIPPGECCGAFRRTVRPLVTGLPSFELGATGPAVVDTTLFKGDYEAIFYADETGIEQLPKGARFVLAPMCAVSARTQSA